MLCADMSLEGVEVLECSLTKIADHFWGREMHGLNMSLGIALVGKILKTHPTSEPGPNFTFLFNYELLHISLTDFWNCSKNYCKNRAPHFFVHSYVPCSCEP